MQVRVTRPRHSSVALSIAKQSHSKVTTSRDIATSDLVSWTEKGLSYLCCADGYSIKSIDWAARLRPAGKPRLLSSLTAEQIYVGFS